MKVDRRAMKGLSRFLAPSAGGAVGERALAEKLISPEQLEECLREAGRPVDQVLVERGYLKAADADRLRQPSLPPGVSEALADEGRRLGHYVLVSLLGEGGMGEVWKAWDLSLERWVAVKRLREDIGRPTQRIEREGRMAGGLSHPNIISIFERGHHEGRPYLVMPYVEGTPPRPPMAPREAARLIREVALALAHAHEVGVIHRDVKPGNILVEAGGRVVLTDFGLATHDDAPGSRLSMSGTPEFASPEQMRGDPLDARTDIYSLGVTLRHLAGERPPAALGRVVRRATEADREGRYASMEEMARDLAGHLEGAGWKALLRPRPLAAILLAGALSWGGTLVVLRRALEAERKVEMLQELGEGEKALARREALNALARFHAALDLGGGADASAGLGRCYELLGQKPRAADAYRRALESAPTTWRLRGEVQKRLDALK